MNIYITGTDYQAGKTIIAAGLTAVMQSLGYKTAVYKPIQTGAIDQKEFMFAPDLAFVKLIDPYIQTHASYILKTHAIPVIAAEVEQKTFDLNYIRNEYEILAAKSDIVAVEDTQSLMTPIATNTYSSEIITSLQIPVLIVVKPTNNAINQTLMTINYLNQSGIKIRGAIINKYPSGTMNPDIRSLPRLIEEYSDVKILGIIKYFNKSDINASTLVDAVLNCIDIEKVFDLKIPKLNMGF